MVANGRYALVAATRDDFVHAMSVHGWPRPDLPSQEFVKSGLYRLRETARVQIRLSKSKGSVRNVL
jgi:hypothetical protein